MKSSNLITTVFHAVSGLVVMTLLSSCGLFGGGKGAINDIAENQVGTTSQPKLPQVKASSTEFADGIAATVNGKVITKSEVRQEVGYVRLILQRQPMDAGERSRRLRELEQKSLEALIDRELFLARYDKAGIPVKARHVNTQIDARIRDQFGGDRAKFTEALRQSGVTMRRFREKQVDSIKVIRMKQFVAQGKTRTPSPREVQRYYEENLTDYRDEGTLKLRTLLIRKRSQRDPLATPTTQRLLAQEVQRKLTQGANFPAMAKTYSEDSAASQGGDRGTITREGPLNAFLTNNAFAMKAGQVSEIIEDQNNYYILKVDSRQYGKASPLSEVRDDVEQNLLAQQRQAIVDKWLKNERKRALIKTY